MEKFSRPPLRLMFIVNDIHFFLSHRLRLAIAAKEIGYDVCIACPQDPRLVSLEGEGFTIVPIKINRRSRSLPVEWSSFRSIKRAIQQFQPNVLHLITSKPVIYGGLAARYLRIPSLFAISGLGYVFTGQTLLHHILRFAVIRAYGWSVNRSNSHVLFQNNNDMEIFRRAALLRRPESSILPGSGVDLTHISATPVPKGKPIVLMPSRMLRDKGVLEFVEAARLLRSQGIDATFRLLGDPDPMNPTSLTVRELEAFSASGAVEWQPHTSDIAGALSDVHLVVLPSYREGFPKTLIDAAAAGRAVATTDVPGCRDAIIPGKTGELFRVKDVSDMARVIKKMLTDRVKLQDMGAAARKHAEDTFDVQRIVDAHLKIYRSLSAEHEPDNT